MAESVFVATTRFREAVALINALPPKRTPMLLSRILGKLHVRHEHIFTEDEEEQLCELLSVSGAELETVLGACSYVFEQSAYLGLRPQALARHLAAVEMEEGKCSAFAATWDAHGEPFLEAMRHRSLFPRAYKGVNWREHVRVADARQTRLKDLTAVFELQLGGQDSAEVTERVNVEFSHAELSAFYERLEKLQEQVDRLS